MPNSEEFLNCMISSKVTVILSVIANFAYCSAGMEFNNVNVCYQGLCAVQGSYMLALLLGFCVLKGLQRPCLVAQ